MRVSVSPFEAAGMALGGYTCWVAADTMVKVAGGSRLPVYEVIAVMGAVIALLLVGRGLWRRDLRRLWPKDPARQMIRSLLDLGNMVGVVIALRHLPLALFYILIFFSPTVTTLLEAVFLKERLEWRKVLAILTGFLGVVVAVNPFGVGWTGDWSGYLACMVCVMCFSANMVLSRVLTQSESPESLTFFSGAVMAVAGVAVTVGRAVPLTAGLVGVLGFAGFCCVVGSLCFFVALRHTSAATVSQYHYSQLVTGALIAYVVWHERLSLSMLVGAALIIGAGGYTAAVSYRATVGVGGMDLAA